MLLLILLFILAEIIVNPIADIPLNDDWTYARSVQMSIEKGTIDISPLSSASIFTHIVWGAIFVKIFGFSFTVLRFSTFISALIGLFFLNKLIVNITQSKIAGFLFSALLLFNPIYFNLCNTYMTDVNFITLIILCLYFAFEFYRDQKAVSFILVFVFSLLAILLRQYGVIIPLCFTVSCLFLKKKRWLYVSLSIAITFVVLYLFKLFEDHLRSTLPTNAAYQFSGAKKISDPDVIAKLIANLEGRYKILLIHLFVYGFPFIAIFLIDLFKSFKLYITIPVVLVSAGLSYFLFNHLGLPMGNVFGNKFVGAETFYQTFEGGFHYELQHFSKNFDWQVTIAKYIFSTGSIAGFILCIFKWLKQKGPFMPGSGFTLVASLLVGYAFIILFTEGFVDRYQLPLILLGSIFFAVCMGKSMGDHKISLIPLVIFFYIGVFGTKDYLEMNRKRWEAFYFVKERLGCPPGKINGGYEVSGWTADDPLNQWAYFMGVDYHYYLIQYKATNGFKRVRDYEFQRYFPYKKDKISIFMSLRKRL